MSLRRLTEVLKAKKARRKTEVYKHSYVIKREKFKKSEEKWKQEIITVYGKYKPVAIKVRPVKTTLPDEYRLV